MVQPWMAVTEKKKSPYRSLLTELQALTCLPAHLVALTTAWTIPQIIPVFLIFYICSLPVNMYTHDIFLFIRLDF
jgi:hypothetical protein